MSNLARLNIFLSKDDLDKLKKLAQKEQTSVSYLIRKAVRDVYRKQLDDNPNNDNDRFHFRAKINI